MKHLKFPSTLYKVCQMGTCFLAFSLVTACSGWFDVSPKTDLKADEMFSSEAGFESSLTGIYLLMTNQGAYGGNMSFGMLDQLAQQYDYIPDGANDRTAIYNYATTTSDGFRTKQKIAQSWLKLYNVIANCNNFIKWLDRKGETVIRNVNTRNTFRAEALAARAYCHFDLLRAWGPWKYGTDAAAADAPCIPYRLVADNSKQPLLPAKEIVKLALKDLNEAKELLAHEKGLRLDNSERRFRFNYHAVNALMARIYCYAAMPQMPWLARKMWLITAD